MPAAVRATDNFNRADSADLGANWDVGTGDDNAEIFSDTARASTVAVVAVESYNAVPFASNQFSETVIHTISIAFEVFFGPICRQQAGAQSHYTGEMGNGAFLRKVVAGVETTLATNATAWANGDVCRLVAFGTWIAQYKNSVLILSADDSALTGGRPGILIFCDTNLSDARIDSWLGGDFAEATDFSKFPKPKIRDAALRGQI